MSIRRELLRVRRSRLAAGIALTAAAAVALTAAGEGVSSDGRDDNNPFHGTGDNGERVHVLPSPGARRAVFNYHHRDNIKSVPGAVRSNQGNPP